LQEEQMSETPDEPLGDDEIETSSAGGSGTTGDADGTDGDATDTVDGDGSDGGDADGTDGGDADGTDGTDG
jgi:hypothetical protein